MHDSAMLAELGFLHDLNVYAFSPMGVPSAYMVILHIY